MLYSLLWSTDNSSAVDDDDARKPRGEKESVTAAAVSANVARMIVAFHAFSKRRER